MNSRVIAYLEGLPLQGFLEVLGVAADYDLVNVELMRSTDDLAVRELSILVSTL